MANGITTHQARIGALVFAVLLALQANLGFAASASAQPLVQETAHSIVLAQDTPTETPSDDGEKDKPTNKDRVKAAFHLAAQQAKEAGLGGALSFINNPTGTLTRTAFDAGKEALSSAWKAPIGKFTKSLVEGNAEVLGAAMTLWTGFNFDPTIGAKNIAGVRNIVVVLTVAALIISLIVGGLRLAAVRSTGLDDGFKDLGAVVVRMMVATSLVPVLTVGGMAISDSLANEIFAQFGPSDMSSFIDLADASGVEKVFGPIIVLLVMVLALAGSAMQVLALAVRFIVVPIVAGLAPLFAAGSMTGVGKNGLNHLYAYLVSAVVFKPIAALLYVTVFWWNDALFKSDAPEDEAGWLAKLLVIVMVGVVGFSAPALVKIISPAAAPTAGGSGAAAIGAAAGVAGVATGAIGLAAGAVAGLAGAGAAAGKEVATGAAKQAGKAAASGSAKVAGSASGGGAARSAEAASGGAGEMGTHVLEQTSENMSETSHKLETDSNPQGPSPTAGDIPGGEQSTPDPSRAGEQVQASAMGGAQQSLPGESQADGAKLGQATDTTGQSQQADGANTTPNAGTNADGQAPTGAQQQQHDSAQGAGTAQQATPDTPASAETRDDAAKGNQGQAAAQSSTPATESGKPAAVASAETQPNIAAQPAAPGVARQAPAAATSAGAQPSATPETRPAGEAAPSAPARPAAVASPQAGTAAGSRGRRMLRRTASAGTAVKKGAYGMQRGANSAAAVLGQIGNAVDQQAGSAPIYYGQIGR